jgi:hypothetical protein
MLNFIRYLIDRGHRNMFRNIITLLFFCCISLSAIAEEITLKNDRPDQYVVVKGDTLWDISGKFLRDPWLWPTIWKLNRDELRNPHLIHPGDVIVLDTSGGSPTLRLLRESVLGHNGKNGQSKGEVTINPSVIIEPLKKEAIPTIPVSSIAPFLNQPLIVESTALNDSPRIIAGQDDRVILSPSSRIYVRGIPNGGNLDWHIYRKGNAMIDPDTKTNLGYEAIYLGDAKITKYGDPATAEIIRAKEEIFATDRLTPLSNMIDNNFIPHAPDFAVKGRIMAIYGGVSEAGAGSIVSINRGHENGIEIGHVLAIQNTGRLIQETEMNKSDSFSLNETIKNTFSSQKKTSKNAMNMVKLPDERAGLLMIFRVFDHVSYGLVMQTEQSIHALDTVINP